MFGWSIVSKEKMALGQRELKIGMKGRDVGELQRILMKLGIYEGPVDGLLGLITEEAVADMEKMLGLPVDGRVGRDLIRLFHRPHAEGAWIIHRLQQGETAKSIADRYEIRVSAVGGRKRLHSQIGKTLLIPKKNLWIWADEFRSGLPCMGCLVKNLNDPERKDGQPRTACRVVDVEEFVTEKGFSGSRLTGSWIIDGRKGSQKQIRQAARGIASIETEEKPWFWLSDYILDVPGAPSFLKLHTGSGLIRLVIELNPPTGDPAKKMKPGYAWMREWRREPFMYSINLLPRLELNGERTELSPKEARLWRYRSQENKTLHIGRFQWAMLPVRHGEEEGRLWFVDAVTMNTLYTLLVQEYRGGMILEGIRGVDPRIIQIYQDYFAIGNIGHEMTLRDIYLKRENL